jgi:hypothetical protein
MSKTGMFTRRGLEIDRKPLGLCARGHERAEHLHQIWDEHYVIHHDNPPISRALASGITLT